MQKNEIYKIWNIDKAHSNIEFTVRHMMISNVRGRFLSFDGDVKFDPDNLNDASIKMMIDSSSIFTNENDRDKHLKSPDFLNVEKYPLVEFVSTSVTRSGEKITVNGNLTIRDVTKQVAITGELEGPIVDPYGKNRIGFDGSAAIARKDFGLTWNMILEGGGLMVGDNVKIDIHMELTSERNKA